MARPLRLEFPGAIYHVTSRGNRRDTIFIDDNDRTIFLALLGDVCDRFNWICHSYCLMTNHYHIIIETVEGNLSRGMRQLNGVYTQKFNLCHERVGHVFQGRYKSILVERETHLLELTRYVVLNPVRAGIVADPSEWEWSSYLPSLGERISPACLHIDWLLSQFSGKECQAVERYRKFVLAGIKGTYKPWVNLKGQIYLGSNDFVEKIKKTIDGDRDLSEIPIGQYRPPVESLGHYEQQKASRNQAIIEAFNSGGYSMKEIADYFNIHYTTVSRILGTR